MNTGITGTMRLLALIILTAAVVACTGNDADTTQFQGPVHGPDALEEAAVPANVVVPDNVVVLDPVAPGPSPSSPDVAPDGTGAVLIPNVDTPGSPLAAQTSLQTGCSHRRGHPRARPEDGGRLARPHRVSGNAQYGLHPVRLAGVIIPHPLDIMAIYAIYQTVDTR